MTSAQVLDSKGNKVREIGLDDDVFGITPNEGLLHTALVRQLANGRSGSANTKTRSEVRGGGKKPWRQKGTGRARAGSIRSPLWEGGGVIFGPKPRDFSITLPKKQRVLALKSALAAKREALVIVENFDAAKNGKTKEFADALKQLKIEGKKVVVVVEKADDNGKLVQRAARNIAGVVVLHVSNLNVKDLIHADSVLVTEKGLEAINNRFKNLPQEKQEEATEKTAKTTKRAAEAKAPAAKEKATKAPAKKATEAETAEKEPKKAKKAE
ncbi:MAG TPA: 50S ribosomal protein L4 [Oculatellaceae cyanobacterium]